jgi:hypothetical protein
VGGVNVLTFLGIMVIAAGIGLAGYGDGLRRVERASTHDPRTRVVHDPRAVLAVRRGVALLVLGLLLAGLGAL